MDIVRVLIGYFNKQEKLEDKIFSFVLAVGTIVVAGSTVVTYAEQLSQWATIFTSLCGLFMIFIFVLAYVYDKKEISRVLMCYLLNVVLLPLTFFSCGGIDSGMPLYLLAGLFITIPILKGKNRTICVVTSLIIDVCMIGISYNMMEGNKAKSQIKLEILAKQIGRASCRERV